MHLPRNCFRSKSYTLLPYPTSMRDDSSMGHTYKASPTMVTLRRFSKSIEFVDCALDSWVTVNRMESSNGAILDPDDRLVDIVDDREQILAIYDERDPVVDDSSIVSSPFAGGSSASLNQVNDGISVPQSASCPTIGMDNSVEITNLMEPPGRLSVCQNGTERENAENFISSFEITYSRFENAPISAEKSNSFAGKRPFSRGKRPAPPPPPHLPEDPIASSISINDQKSPTPPVFSRNSARKSRLADKWLEAAEKICDEVEEKQEKVEIIREPRTSSMVANFTLMIANYLDQPLAIDVEPELSSTAKLTSVLVVNMDENGRAKKDGKLLVGDRIVEINNRPVYQMSLHRARAYLQELADIHLKVLRLGSHAPDVSDGNSMKLHTRLGSALQHANTTKLGRIVSISLRKGNHGFGFTITSRDTAAGERLFYIKTVLPHSSARIDGRLRAGDRLLQSLTGRTQKNVVDRLRTFQIGDSVHLLISRLDEQEIIEPLVSPSKPRQLEDVELESMDNVGHSKRILNFDIALNDTGSAGLGVSVKGRAQWTTIEGVQKDCGIFVKAILHGGAAHKDGRLKVNDQLISIEQLDLKARTNSEAMQLIGRTMRLVGPTAANIRLVVSRAISNIDDQQQQQQQQVPRASAIDTDDYTTVTKHRAWFEKPMIVNDCQDACNNALQYRDKYDNQLPSTSASQKNLIYEEIDDLSSVGEPEIWEAFIREAPGRRSMSEKRHARSGLDPNHTATLQRIKHERQTSAPPIGRNSMLAVPLKNERNITAKIRDSSQTIPRLDNLEKPLKWTNNRRLIHELAPEKRAAKPSSKKVQRSRLTNDSFRQAVDRSYNEDGRVVTSNCSSSPVPEEPRPCSSLNREKPRRKSVGSGLFSRGWFCLGSGRQKENKDHENGHWRRMSKAESAVKQQRPNLDKCSINLQREQLKRQQLGNVTKQYAFFQQNTNPVPIRPPVIARGLARTPPYSYAHPIETNSDYGPTVFADDPFQRHYSTFSQYSSRDLRIPSSSSTGYFDLFNTCFNEQQPTPSQFHQFPPSLPPSYRIDHRRVVSSPFESTISSPNQSRRNQKKITRF